MNLLTLSGRCTALFACTLISLHSLPAQMRFVRDRNPESIVQEIFPVLPEDADPEALFEYFVELLNDPLEINSITADQLRSTLIPGEQQITSFFEYREKAGPFLSIYELQAIPGWDLETISRLIPFLILSEKVLPLKESLAAPTQHFLMLRAKRVLEKSKGYSAPEKEGSSRYAGNESQFYLRYRYARTGVFSFGFTLEKDPGEIWVWEPKKQIYGIDYTSFHLQLANRGKLKNFIVGDFQAQFGQGLVFASGLSLGKGAEVVQSAHRSSTGIRPYTSAIENHFFRGAAATIELRPNLALSLIASFRFADATLSEKKTTVITSFPTDGFHRTSNEMSKHGNIKEQNYGGDLAYKFQKIPLTVGLSTLYTCYNFPVEKKELPYNEFEFKGRENIIFGIHSTYRLRNQHFFAESAKSLGGGAGTVTGTIIALNKYWDATLLYRLYQKDFHSFYGNPFKESSRPSNEKGIYGGIRYSPSKKWQHSAYLDLFKFPEKKYQVDTTSSGYGFLLHTNWKPSKTFRAFASFQQERKEKNNKGKGITPLPLVKTVRNTAALSVEWNRPMRYTLRTRVQGTRFQFGETEPSLGFALIQDGTIKYKKFEASGRFAFFRTEDYDSRQYAFERDVLYAFSLPAYYDHGTRHYLMLRYQVFYAMRIWVRWSQSRYSRLDTIGSGLDEYKGKTKSEIKLQVMYQF